MRLLDRVHGDWIFRRRVRVLGEAGARAVQPLPIASLLDVGCGDGQITHTISRAKPGLSVQGIDVFVRKDAHIPVRVFDGLALPFADASFDAVMAVDVLHHAAEPLNLLREMERVSRRWILIKDHEGNRPLARAILRAMDWVGNQRHGVDLPYNYLSHTEWSDAFRSLGLRLVSRDPVSSLYAPPLNFAFGGDLQFFSVLEKQPAHA